MLIRTHIGVSLDGFMASPDGMPAWDAVPTFVPGESHGYAEFIAQCEAIVIGRAVFDFGHAYWTEQGGWPWEGRRVYVLTSHPLPANPHASVAGAEGSPAGLVARLRGAGLTRDVQVLGGARTLRAFLGLGAIDRLGVVVLPILLGDGIPLYAPGAAPRSALRLERHRAFPDGAVELVYTRADGGETR
ncbi:MAG TPA: dihydrofolate reductase family protein [Thermomicrobiales bacterium]|nr:dihydrofolate reductase family protein [Thermomicrobiales bacterium]